MEFYDLERDLREYNNRAWDDVYSDKREKLFRELDAWMARMNDYPPGLDPKGDAVDGVTGQPGSGGTDCSFGLSGTSRRGYFPWLKKHHQRVRVLEVQNEARAG